MTRPIPEGVVPSGCKMSYPGRYASDDDCGICERGEGDVCPEYTKAVAAYRNSEVARLNTNPNQISTSAVYPKDALIDDKAAMLNQSSAAPREGETLSTETRQTADVQDKDALIRELVGALEGLLTSWRDKSKEGNEYLHGVRLASIKADATLTLARTTCPEAFDGCNENSTS